MKRAARRALSVATALAAGAALAATGCAPLPPVRVFAGRIAPFREGGRFVVVGDLQRTSLLEFWRESNDAERAVLVQAIPAAKPAFVAMLGDLVFDGASPAKWAAFDALCAPIRDAEVPVFAALGNHEYWGGPSGVDRFFERFPHLEKKHFYSVSYGPLRLVVLDSNLDELSPAMRDAQQAWYTESLAAFDADPAVRGVLVLLHHPPYTNSTVTSDEVTVERAFVPALLRATKTLGLISGHVHSYERFERAGKLFLVSGGGGGPRARLAEGRARRHPDDLFEGPPIRRFHFTIFTITERGLDAEVMGLGKGEVRLAPMDHFSLRWR